MEEYVGMIKIVGFNWAPVNFLPCDGRTLSQSEYPVLYSLIGTTYGQGNAGTFNLPNMAGRIPVGAGTGTGLSLPISLGQSGGYQGINLVAAQVPAHTHAATAQLPVSAVTATQKSPQGNFLAESTGHFVHYNTKSNVNMAPSTSQTGLAGGSQPMMIQNPYVGLQYIICVIGIFPPNPNS